MTLDWPCPDCGEEETYCNHRRIREAVQARDEEIGRLQGAIEIVRDYGDLELRQRVHVYLAGDPDLLREPICGVISHSGPNKEPLACGFAPGHQRGPLKSHSWSTLPTFTPSAQRNDEVQG